MPTLREGIKLDFSDVLFEPQETTLASRADVSLTTTSTFLHSRQQLQCVPVIASNMDTVGTFEMASAMAKHQLLTTIHKHYTVDQWVEFAAANKDILKNVAVSTGISQDDLERLDQIFEKVHDIGMLCIDVANGYSQTFVEVVRATRAKYPNKTIMAGNVVTPGMVAKLIMAGADIVKIGIGPGSVCTTRKKTGVGYPQLSAVLECAPAAHALGAHIISDGGCTVPGDVAKAFGAGADFVMLGGMLAGHQQCPGEVQTDEASGKQFKLFYGMSSKHAQNIYSAGLASYRASEGKVVKVPYRGDVNATLLDVLGGLRSTCTYTNSAQLKALPTNTVFIHVQRQLNEVFSSLEVSS